MVSTLMLIPMWQQRSTITVDCWVSNRSRRLKPALRTCWPGWSDSGRWSGLVLRALGGGVSDWSRFLTDQEIVVVVVDRPNRQKRRKPGEVRSH